MFVLVNDDNSFINCVFSFKINTFIKHISGVRTQELKYLKGRKYLDALCVYFWATTPVVICILTFATYALLGNKLTAATVFTAVALLNMLIAPLNAFPWVLNGMVESWVSIKRIQKLLQVHTRWFDGAGLIKCYFRSFQIWT